MENLLLTGIYDMHIHTAPDVVPRRCGDLEAARRMLDAGMRGGVIKNHYLDTACRAELLKEQFPTLRFFGGITLNRSVGGLNPWAAERSAQAGGKMLWFPTLEAREYQRYQHRSEPDADLSMYIPVCDENGKLLPAALDVLDVAAQHKLVVGTGHIGSLEGMALVREGVRRGCTMVLTHCDNPADQYSVEQQVEAAKLGAFIEHSYFTTHYGRTSAEEITRQIRAVGVESVILDTDFGQVKSPYFDEGMQMYARQLMEVGVTRDELMQMMQANPERLVG